MNRSVTAGFTVCLGLCLPGLAPGPMGSCRAQNGASAPLSTAVGRVQDSTAGGAILDITEAERFVRRVFDELDVPRYAEAAEIYLEILERLDGPVAPEAERIILQHLWELAVVLPASERGFLAIDQAVSESDVGLLREGSGQRLTTWWRRQDDLPATEDNERLEEHLTRTAFVHRQYPFDGRPGGVDDRGSIYIRFGEPSYIASLELRDPELVLNPYVARLGGNEIWLYEHVDSDAHYFFLQRSGNGPFELAYPTDMIPTELRASRRRAGLLLHLMEEIYAQLALINPAYGAQYDEIVVWRALPPASQGSPESFALRWFADALSEDQHHEWRLENAVPAFNSDTRGSAALLPVSVRWARFLDADGTTRTEIYWALDAGAMQPSRRLERRLKREGNEPSREYLLSVAVTQRTSEFAPRHINRKHYLIPTRPDEAVPGRVIVAHGDTGTYHLAVQWDQRWTRRVPVGSSNLVPGATLKIGTRMLDSLQALDNSELALVMSDLKPVVVEPDHEIESAQPYPSFRLSPDFSLGLYFELYNLSYGPDDRTHYSIEYEVERNPIRGGLLSFLGTSEAESTGARTAYSGEARIAREYVLLDVGDWEGKGELDITVRVTDETTGAEATRTIRFEWGQ